MSELKIPGKCPGCGGSGEISGLVEAGVKVSKNVRCYVCDGTGERRPLTQEHFDIVLNTIEAKIFEWEDYITNPEDGHNEPRMMKAKSSAETLHWVLNILRVE